MFIVHKSVTSWRIFISDAELSTFTIEQECCLGLIKFWLFTLYRFFRFWIGVDSVPKLTNIRYILVLFDTSNWIPTRAACRSRDASLSKTSVALSQQEIFFAKMSWLDLSRPKFLKFFRRVQIIVKYVPHVHPKSNLGGFWMKFFKGGAIWNMIYIPSRLLQ